ncbi:MAG TPA: hypothetical protein ENI88_03010 [Desulfobulbus sp.]|nr:hypothetical protein [Desulfobulbus sp.]
MSKHWKTGLFVMVLSGIFAASAWAVPTRLTVRTLAHDAKFIGSVVGGMKVVVKDYYTEQVLASGMIMGATGDTKLLMTQPVTRGMVRSKGKATAKAVFEFDIDDPLKLLVEVIGPMGAEADIHKEVKTTWLLPGQDIAGDGLLFEMTGLIVHPHNPEAHEFFPLGATLPITAVVTPMCGCPIQADSPLWNARDYTVKATIYKGSKIIAELPLKYADKTSNFGTSFTPKEAGGYRVIFTAHDKRNNQGVGISGFVVAAPKK